MSIDKIDPVFAQSGAVDTDETFDTWAGGGYVDEPVRYKGLNKVLRRGDEKINDVVDGINSHPRYLTLPGVEVEEERIVKAFYPHATGGGAMRDPANSFSLSNSQYKIRGCTYVDNPSRGTGLVFAVDLGLFIFCDIKTETQSIIVSLQSLLGWATSTAAAVCADNSYLYAVVYESSSSTPRLVAVDISDGSMHPDWPSSGVELSAYAETFESYNVTVRWVDSNKIAVSQPWVSVTSGSSHAIRVIDAADGSVLGSGAGDYAGSSGQCVGVCGDGERAYFVIRESSTTYICSMDLAAYGASGGGTTGWPIEGPDADLGDICCAGDTVVASWIDSASELIRVASGTIEYQAGLDRSDSGYLHVIRRLVYTNLSWWGIGGEGDGGAASAFFYRLDFLDERFDSANPTDRSTTKRFFCNSGHSPLSDPHERVVFDGSNIWIAGGISGSDASHNFYRLPLVGGRH